MITYAIRLKKREEVAEGTMAFHFERPAGFQFKAGQYFLLTLIDPAETDAEGNDRTFSIASAPFESDLIVATRMRDSAFKRVLKTIPIGTEVNMEGPYGSFVLHNDASRPAVLLAGGIGITPVRSMILQAAREKLPQRIYLFYSNRRPEDAAFLEELQKMENENPHYRFIGTMTDMEKSHQPWRGETGYIHREMIAKFIEDFSAPIYYVVGPPGMVGSMRSVLARAGVSNEKIRAEEFAGY